MRFRYTEQQLDFLRDHYKAMLVPDLTEKFNSTFGLNKTPGQIKSTLKNYKIRSGRPRCSTPGAYRVFTKSQAEFIRSNYPKFTRKELTKKVNEAFNINVTEKQVCSFVKNHKIKSGRTGQFQKGNKGWNTGTKGLTKANTGSFKKKHHPANKMKVGSERVNTDGYIDIKIAEPDVWKAKSKIIWEQYNGAIPQDHILRFKDGNKLNCNIENLELLNRREHLYLNLLQYDKKPEEIKPSVLAIAKLNSKCYEAEHGN